MPGGAASPTIDANSSSYTSTRGCSRSSTPFSSAAEKDVFSISACAPSLADANTDSTRAEPFRHRIPMRSPDSSPSSAKPRASAFVRRSSSAQVTAPSASITAAWSGRVIAFTTQAVAGRGAPPVEGEAGTYEPVRADRAQHASPREHRNGLDLRLQGKPHAANHIGRAWTGGGAAAVRYGEIVIGSWGFATRALAGALVAAAAAVPLGCGDDGNTAGVDPSPPPPEEVDFPRPSGRSFRDLLGHLRQGPVVAPSVSLLEPGANRFGFALFDRGNRQIGNLDVALYVAGGIDETAHGPFEADYRRIEVDSEFQSRNSTQDPDSARSVYVAEVEFGRAAARMWCRRSRS